MIYLHYFETNSEFKSVYNNEGEERTLTTFQCSAGTFYFHEGQPGNYGWIDAPDAASATKMLMTFGPNPNVGIMTAESYQALMAHAQEMMESGATEEEALEYVGANFLGAVDDGSDEFVEITSVGSITTQVYHEPWVSLTKENDEINYNKADYATIPFTIEALKSGSITWNLYGLSLQYSKNGGPWETMDSATTISVVKGDEVQFKGTNTSYCGNTISATAPFKVKGNIMSLTNADDFKTANSVNTSGFTRLFNGCTYLVSASDLKLPATTLAGYCYNDMFHNCTNLTTAPELPATTLAESCYYGMFDGCTSLTAAPELPATTLAFGCYGYMFHGCTRLTTAPELPATTLADLCYKNMFDNCTRLTTAPELPATTLMRECYSYMFDGCRNLTTAPELPATTLVVQCYYNMFNGCTNLNYIKCLATNISATFCTQYWVEGVSSTGTFVKNPSMSSWTTGANGIPANWTVQNAS